MQSKVNELIDPPCMGMQMLSSVGYPLPFHSICSIIFGHVCIGSYLSISKNFISGGSKHDEICRPFFESTGTERVIASIELSHIIGTSLEGVPSILFFTASIWGCIFLVTTNVAVLSSWQNTWIERRIGCLGRRLSTPFKVSKS